MPDIIFLEAAKSLVQKHKMSGPSLREAIPFLKKFEGKTFVLKIGGSVLNDYGLLPCLVDDVVFLDKLGIRIILVHGGSRQMDAAMKDKGIAPVKVDGLRFTSEEVLKLASSVFSQISRDIKNEIEGQDSGVKGVVFDKDSGLIKGKKKSKEFGLVGIPGSVNTTILEALADNIIPIVPAVIADEDGGCGLNVNADDVAASLATALKAEKLILMTDVEGVIDKEGNLISTLESSVIDGLIADGTISGGMLPKVQSCLEPVRNGVKKAHIIKGGADSFIGEVLTAKGVGTEFVMSSQAKVKKLSLY